MLPVIVASLKTRFFIPNTPAFYPYRTDFNQTYHCLPYEASATNLSKQQTKAYLWPTHLLAYSGIGFLASVAL